MARVRIQYTTPQDKANDIANYTGQGYVLVEEQSYVDGNYLVFSNDPSALNPIQMASDIQAALPSWAQVQTAINGLGLSSAVTNFLTKLCRVVYWLAKNSPT